KKISGVDIWVILVQEYSFNFHLTYFIQQYKGLPQMDTRKLLNYFSKTIEWILQQMIIMVQNRIYLTTNDHSFLIQLIQQYEWLPQMDTGKLLNYFSKTIE